MPLNEMTRYNRAHKFAAAKIKKDLTLKVKLLTMAQSRIRLEGLYDLRIIWTVNSKHDSDNIFSQVKFLLDGIVEAGVLPSDRRKYIRNISNEIVDGDKNIIDIYFSEVKLL